MHLITSLSVLVRLFITIISLSPSSALPLVPRGFFSSIFSKPSNPVPQAGALSALVNSANKVNGIPASGGSPQLQFWTKPNCQGSKTIKTEMIWFNKCYDMGSDAKSLCYNSGTWPSTLNLKVPPRAQTFNQKGCKGTPNDLGANPAGGKAIDKAKSFKWVV